jgi:hypothetical protein
MQQYLESKLYSDVEGTCSGQFGFIIIAVVSISDIGKGMVISDKGQAHPQRHPRTCISPLDRVKADSSDQMGIICRGRPSQLFRLAAGTSSDSRISIPCLAKEVTECLRLG